MNHLPLSCATARGSRQASTILSHSQGQGPPLIRIYSSGLISHYYQKAFYFYQVNFLLFFFLPPHIRFLLVSVSFFFFLKYFFSHLSNLYIQTSVNPTLQQLLSLHLKSTKANQNHKNVFIPLNPLLALLELYLKTLTLTN